MVVDAKGHEITEPFTESAGLGAGVTGGAPPLEGEAAAGGAAPPPPPAEGMVVDEE